MMDNRAQVSLEYLIIVSALVVMAAVIMVLALNIFSLKEGIKERGTTFIEKTSEMLG